MFSDIAGSVFDDSNLVLTSVAVAVILPAWKRKNRGVFYR